MESNEGGILKQIYRDVKRDSGRERNIEPADLQSLVTTVHVHKRTTFWKLTSEAEISKSTLHERLDQGLLFIAEAL